MKAKFISTEGDYLEAIIEVEGCILHVMDGFSGKNCIAGDNIEIDMYPGLFCEEEEWGSIFSCNQNSEKKIRTSIWLAIQSIRSC